VSAPDDETSRHNRRYMAFAVIFAIVVLGFAALAITIAATNTP